LKLLLEELKIRIIRQILIKIMTKFSKIEYLNSKGAEFKNNEKVKGEKHNGPLTR